jgi:hypothetical protein
MSWIKLDDQWMDHPKMILVGRDARDMWLASVTYCSKHLTDGFFSDKLLPQLAVMAGVDVAKVWQFATALVEVCLWDACDGGYMVHDYLEYNPTKEQALATREARKEAGRAGGVAKASKMASKNVAKPKQNSSKSLPPPRTPIPEELREESAAPAKPDAAAKPKRKQLSPEDKALADKAKTLVCTFADVSQIPVIQKEWPRYMRKAKERA